MNTNIYVLYGSQTGNSEEISKIIYKLLIEKGYNCKHSSLNNSIQNDTFNFIQDEKSTVIIVCSTTGNGDSPESATYFWNKLKSRKQPKNLFNGVKYTILGLGDTNYDKFCYMGKNIDRRFNELGGERFIELHCLDEAVNNEDTVDIFIDKILKYFMK